MKSTLLSITLVCCIALASALACSKESSEATVSESSVQTEPVTIAKADPAPQTSTLPMGGDVAAAEAWDAIKREMMEIQKTATTQQKMMEAVEKVEALLVQFIDTYPETAESMDARFELGTLYVATRRPEKSIAYLAEYLDYADGNREKTCFAHYYLAESYKATDQYEKAEKHYRAILDSYADVNPQITSMVQTMLADMPTLKQLRVGGTPIAIAEKDLDGNLIDLADYKGKVVLLDFWATWCKPCIAEMPNVIKLYNKHSDDGFEIIGISLDTSRPRLESYVKSNKMMWPQLFDGKGWGNEIANKYKVRSIPETYLIDREGKIRYRSIRGRDLEQAVAELLKTS